MSSPATEGVVRLAIALAHHGLSIEAEAADGPDEGVEGSGAPELAAFFVVPGEAADDGGLCGVMTVTAEGASVSTGIGGSAVHASLAVGLA